MGFWRRLLPGSSKLRSRDAEGIRGDFPVLRDSDLIYLDSACMSLRPDPVVKAVTGYYTEYPTCSGRSAHRLAERASYEVERAREAVRKFLGASEAREIIFTRNTTEGINLVASVLDWQPGDVVLTSDREHNSNLLPWQRLAEQRGVVHRPVPSDDEEKFDMEAFRRIMADADRVKLVSVVHTSNLDGYTLPVKEIVGVARQHDALVLVDGAQSAGHVPVDLQELGADFFAMSGHKACGPSGVGCLYVRNGLLDRLPPFMLGGGTVDNSRYDGADYAEPPAKFEAGLQNIAGIVGFRAACEYLRKIGRKEIHRRERRLVQTLADRTADIDEVERVGVTDPEVTSGIFNFRVRNLDTHEVALLLNERSNIAVRSGMHCLHSWYNARDLDGSTRASFYLYNNEEEVEAVARDLRMIARLA